MGKEGDGMLPRWFDLLQLGVNINVNGNERMFGESCDRLELDFIKHITGRRSNY